MRALVVAALALTVAVGVGCGASSEEAMPKAKVTIVLTDGAYHPARVEIEAGDRVTFVNSSQRINTAESPGVGDFTSQDGLATVSGDEMRRRGRFDTRILDPGEAETVRFDKPGVYPFDSSLSDMEGTVVVTPRRAGSTAALPGDARAATSAVRELQRAFAKRDLAAICSGMTANAKLEAGRVAHGRPGACDQDLREAFKVIEQGGGIDKGSSRRIAATRVDGDRAAVILVGRHGRTAVPLAWHEGRWLLDSFFGTPRADAKRIAAAARRRPFPTAVATPVTLRDDTDQRCFDPFVDLPIVTGDCGYTAADTRVTISIATVFGEFRFGVCKVSVQVATAADGRSWTSVAVTSPVNNGCADIRPCSVAGNTLPWKSRIARKRDRSLVHRIDACFDTCIGAYVGPLTLSISGKRDSGRMIAVHSRVGASGLGIRGMLTVTRDDLRL